MTTPDSPKPETCPRCDRAECPRIMGIMAMSLTMEAFNNCERHAVDWRARALAAEARTADIARDVAIVREVLMQNSPHLCLFNGAGDRVDVSCALAALSRIEGAAK